MRRDAGSDGRGYGIILRYVDLTVRAENGTSSLPRIPYISLSVLTLVFVFDDKNGKTVCKLIILV